MATGLKGDSPASKQKRAATKPSSADAPPHQMLFWKGTLLLLLAFCLTGIVPVAIVAYAAGPLNLTPSSFAALFPQPKAPTPTDVPDLALPRDAWVTQSVNVLPDPARGSALATLAPAFPVRLLEHKRVGNTIWSRVEWSGPVAGTGGEGWVPDGLLISYGATGAILGDLGALAPSLRQAVAPAGKQFAAMVYIPSQNRLYTQGAPDGFFALGTGLRPMQLSALYSGAEAQNKAVSLTDALALSHGDATVTPRIYQQLGGAAGLSLYLSSKSVQGIQTAPTWAACHATPRALIDFYTQLAGDLLQAKDRSAVYSVLALADAPTTTNLVAPWARAAGNLLVVGIAPTDATFTVSVAGVLNPAKGPQVIVMAVATAQSSTDAAFQAMKAFYTPLTTLFGG
ncbi:MAG TPA: hypothetical protein VH591_17405 [Ktedonobacterales bacterium]